MTHTCHRRSFMIALVLLTLALVAGTQAGVAGAASDSTDIIPPTARPYGHTYGEWSNLWFQWAYSMPVTHGHEQDHPLLDTTGANCRRNQVGPVFFLAGVFRSYSDAGLLGQEIKAVPVDRTECVVPAGMAIFFPILNVAVFNSKGDNPLNESSTESQMRDALRGYVGEMEGMAATVDGAEIKNWSDYLVGPDNPFTPVTIPADNVFDYFGEPIAPGTYSKLGTAGYYLMLNPLSVGQHVIRFSGTTVGELAVDVTYHLTVRSSSELRTPAGVPGTEGPGNEYLSALILALLGSVFAGTALVLKRREV